jgi:hypothetical protein
VLHLAFVLNNALGWPACFVGHRRPPVRNRKRLAKSSVSSRLGEAEHHKVVVTAAQGVLELCRRQDASSAKYHLTVHEAADLFGQERRVMPPIGLDVGRDDFALRRVIAVSPIGLCRHVRHTGASLRREDRGELVPIHLSVAVGALGRAKRSRRHPLS